jgi:hypothetical protein
MKNNLKPIKRTFKEGSSIFDKVWLSMVEPQKYSPSDKTLDIKTRWNLVLTLRLKGKSRLFITKKLQDQFDISEGQAYQDYQNSDHFYGNVLKADQLGTRAILGEYALKAYRDTLKKGTLKDRLKAIELIARFAGVGDDDIQQFNPEKFENKETVLSIPAELMAAIVEKLNGGVIDFNQFQAEDAEFIDLSEDA